mmetsp:Transcript_58672/g.169803  ORF Transcript_58672/g.169803 Transcript_58672/m.169803 type:complete len:307 (-) Transcript_58672:274-1194(-)
MQTVALELCRPGDHGAIADGLNAAILLEDALVDAHEFPVVPVVEHGAHRDQVEEASWLHGVGDGELEPQEIVTAWLPIVPPALPTVHNLAGGPERVRIEHRHLRAEEVRRSPELLRGATDDPHWRRFSGPLHRCLPPLKPLLRARYEVQIRERLHGRGLADRIGEVERQIPSKAAKERVAQPDVHALLLRNGPKIGGLLQPGVACCFAILLCVAFNEQPLAQCDPAMTLGDAAEFHATPTLQSQGQQRCGGVHCHRAVVAIADAHHTLACVRPAETCQVKAAEALIGGLVASHEILPGVRHEATCS